MHKPGYRKLFKPLIMGRLQLKNRIVMTPLYLGYAALGGKVSPLLLAHYKRIAQSGAALVIAENASMTPSGSTSPRVLRCDHDRYVKGLARLAGTIKAEKTLAGLQINHGGSYADVANPRVPSAEVASGKALHALTRSEIALIQKQFAKAALRVKTAGFDSVELHGSAGYLLSQFVSPRTNKRTDEYGGPLENRIRFPLETLQRVKDAVGDFPVGYRLLADDWLPGGWHIHEAGILATALEKKGADYLSVTGGSHESASLPEVVQKTRKPGYAVSLAQAVKSAVRLPVITAGRISTPRLAESILAAKQADLIGLARNLWLDPDWIIKAREGREAEIITCSPKCHYCAGMVHAGKPPFCPRWSKKKQNAMKALFV